MESVEFNISRCAPRIRICKESWEKNPWGDNINIRFAYEDQQTGQTFVANPVTFEAVDPLSFGKPTDPMLQVCIKGPNAEGFLTAMMDQLWAMGVRPSDIGTPGHLAATQKHLEDMRSLVGGLIKIPLPT